jgi:transcriptional regulator with AAA-type ATPase domain/tetratricopeptide (TPR) repeat protein
VFLALRAEIALGLGRFAAALEWAGEALKGVHSGEGLLHGLECSRIRALLGLGRFHEAEISVETRLLGLHPQGVEVSLFRAQISHHAGRLQQAEDEGAEACSRAIASRQRARLVEALLQRVRTARERGDAAGARAHLDRAQRVSNGLRDASALASVLSDRADLMAHHGRWSEAAKDADRSGRLFARTFSPHEHLSAGRRTGLLGLAQGNPNAALPAIERAAEVARRGFGAAACRAEIDLLFADARLAAHDPEGSLERASAALSFFRDARDNSGLARAHVRRALAAFSASNPTLALREARLARAIKGAGPVADGLADMALGRVLLSKDPAEACARFDRAAGNAGLYPPLRSVARLGAALARGVSPHSDEVGKSMAAIEAFGDLRILAIVRSDLREMYGVEPAPAGGNGIRLAGDEDPEEEESNEGVVEFLPGLVGACEPVRRLSDLVRRVAPSNLPVSIYGETGTGKEKIARAIHDLSPRKDREFVAVNAASFSDELFESEIFGHVRGAFTGAITDRVGLVEKARGGTLFIDEVAELSLRSQARLLRFVQEGTYRRLGETQERRAEVRIVAAANQRLEELTAAGRFREDLLHRLRGVTVTVPPLRSRGADIVRLARHFIALAGSRAARLSPESESELRAYSWPGNVRELEHEMRRAIVLADSPRIEWRRPREVPATSPAPREPEVGPRASLHEVVRGTERNHLKSVLSRCVERAEAARMLGISRQALHQKILRYGL